MTGAPVPDGADAVVMVERTRPADGGVLVHVTAKPGENIRKLGEDKTILLSTHILQEVEAMASRVIMINEGRLVYDGLDHTFSFEVPDPGAAPTA